MNLSFYPKQINMYRETNLTTGLSHFIQLSAHHLKIIAIAVVMMALLAELTYLCWRSYRWKASNPGELEQPPKEVKIPLPSPMPKSEKINEESEVQGSDLQKYREEGSKREGPEANPYDKPKEVVELKLQAVNLPAERKDTEEPKLQSVNLPAERKETEEPKLQGDNLPAERKDTEEAMLLEADLQRKSPSKQDEHPQSQDEHPQSIVERPKLMETPQPGPTQPEIDPTPNKIIIPPVPDIDVTALYRELARQTQAVPSLPYVYGNCHFTDILCPKETRVQLHGSSEGFYLHANYVKLEGLKFIATQYPTPQQTHLFWRAAQKACLVLDLTNQKDLNKGLFVYYPKIGKKKDYGKVSVECQSKQNYKDIPFPIYHYSIIDKGDEQPIEPHPEIDQHAYQIARLHFEEWNDHYGLTEDELDQLLAVMSYHQKDVEDPVMVHCRAGVGRTGTIIVARVLQHLINQKKVTPSNLIENLSRLILEGRQQRGVAFVQTPEQILALWKWGWRAAHRGPMEAKTLVLEEIV